MDFFEISSKNVETLTRNERALFDFVVKNMDAIKNQSIREVSAECFVSTTTFLRFVRKLGFSGYSEFTTVLKFTLFNKVEVKPSPFVVDQKKYREEYLKNIIESVRVLETTKIDTISKKLRNHPKIYIFAKRLSKTVARYVKYLYSTSGFLVEFPEDQQYRQAVIPHIGKEDIVFIFTYDGKDSELIQIAQKLQALKNSPFIISITGADNNIIQNLSDINLYIFTDEIEMNQLDITSRISTIAIMELILYQYMEDTHQLT
ncbi:MurR/RpiR family transcriptional regulator [Bacillus massiliigorillae]|uniref:MurR/RpiR family transcriptional regulator n=1 Tax=Bacillus massiliigorillae TaxID=1243664 RepID=UPI00039DD105|nr:MurR/RpiR family transcriptional regulator [Bacillus massiliigorillae]